MSSASFAVTYTSVYIDSEPGRVFWGAEEELSDEGSPRVIMYEYDRLPMLPVAPPSPDYIPGLEEPHTPPAPQDEDEHEPMFIQPHDPDYMLEPIYPEYIPLEDEHILLAEEHPLPPVVSPTAELPGYVAESDPEEDPEEYDYDETEDGSVDYPIDGGDDGDDDDGELALANKDSPGDDTDDEDKEEDDLAPADSAVVIPTDELAAISFSPEAEVERLLAMPTPSPSPLASLSPPSAGERLARCTAPAALPSPPLPPPLHMPYLLTVRMISPRLRCHLARGRGIDYGFVSTLYAEARRRGIGEVGYGIRDTWIDPAETVPELAPMSMGERVDLLMEDRIANQETIQIVEDEAYAIREVWAHSIGLSQAVHFELQTHQEQVYAYEFQLQTHRTQLQLQSTLIQTQHQLHKTHFQMQQTEIAELRETDHRRQAQIEETLRVMGDMRRDMGDIQGSRTLPNNTNPNNMTPESVQATIDQALLRNSTNRDGSHSSYEDNQRNVQTACPCFYSDFMKCQPLNSKGTEGVVKFATCTLLDAALTWWNSQIRSLGPGAYSMTWEVKENNVSVYTKHFQELTLICTKFVAEEVEKIDKYVSGLPDNIYGSVKASKLKTLDETIELANDLMDQKLRTYVERQSKNKRKVDESFRNNHSHKQQTPKRQNVAKVYNIVAKVYNMRTGERKPYSGNLSKCTKCHFYHNGPCTQKCHKCNKVRHFARDCRSSSNANVANAQRNNRANPKGNGCFECGATGHFKRDCPKLKNKDGEKVNAPGWVYAVENAKKKRNASRDPDSNFVMGAFLLNNRYASILFDTGADRSFISTVFSSLIDFVPTPLGNSYDVELADGKIVEVDTIMRGCTLNFLGHPFNIDLMPVELGRFDVIIGMDWLRRCHVAIVCDEKLVQIPYRNETLTFRSNENNNGRESRLTAISCSKAQEYIAKGCQIFLTQISAKKEEDKSEGKQLKDVPVIRDYPEVFPKDFSGLPPARPVEFQIDLIPGAAPVPRATYRLASSEMKELSEKLQELSKKAS
nr:hypothetical protein [Tanacetum cinerariifolium]